MPRAAEHVLTRVPFSSLHETDKVDQVVQRLDHAIAAGLLPTGSRLPPEALLARMLGISLTTLRAALGILRLRGTITTRRGRQGGSIVTADPEAVRAAAIARLRALGPSEVRDEGDLHAAILTRGATLAAERATDGERLALSLAATMLDELSLMHELQLHLELVALAQSTKLLEAELDCLLWFGGFLQLRSDIEKRAMLASLGSLVEAVAEGTSEEAGRRAQRHAERMTRWVHATLIAKTHEDGQR